MTKFEEELSSLPVSKSTNYTEYWNKAQLLTVFKYWQPQQALPVVPECVGSFLTDKSILGIANGLIPDDVISWVQEQTYYVDLEKIISHLISIKVKGFTVEKPQLFYLKHIDMSETNEHYDYYSTKNQDGSLNHVGIEKRWTPKTLDYTCKFTQQEIDSMNTGSYERIEVAE